MLYTKSVTLTTSAEANIFTVPTGYVAHVQHVLEANHSGSTKALTLWWDKLSGTDFYLYDATNVADGTHEHHALLLVLQPGDSIKAQLGSTGNVNIAVTFDLLEAPIAMVAFNGS